MIVTDGGFEMFVTDAAIIGDEDISSISSDGGSSQEELGRAVYATGGYGNDADAGFGIEGSPDELVSTDVVRYGIFA